MAILFEELDYQQTPIGEVVLRRRQSPSVPEGLVYEVTIDGEMLMSSTINASEKALADLPLMERGDAPCDVLVGGLGLGYTAAAALEHAHVQKVVVAELLEPVISWQEKRLVPMAETLMDDPRCGIIQADFFQYVRQGEARYDVILLDIDHSPESWLHERNAEFYDAAGLNGLLDSLNPDGVFALWSAWEPATEFMEALSSVFPSVQAHEIPFFNPHIQEMDTNWVVTAQGV